MSSYVLKSSSMIHLSNFTLLFNMKALSKIVEFQACLKNVSSPRDALLKQITNLTMETGKCLEKQQTILLLL